jgi:DNA polymerase-3 subunit delta'
LALDLACAVNCEGDEPPCGECRQCRRIREGKHADVRTIFRLRDEQRSDKRLKLEITIDQIRELQHDASLQPFEGRYRVFIIAEAHRLNIEAANCLLKTLEEPPAHTMLVLLTADEGAVLSTIRSRCQRVELRPMGMTAIESLLRERWAIEPDRAALLARLSRGCVGWALNAATDQDLLEERIELADRLLGVEDGELGDAFDFANDLGSRFASEPDQVEATLDLWQDLWHDIMLIKTGNEPYVANIDVRDQLRARAGNVSLPRVVEFIRRLRETKVALRQNANPRLALEVLMLDSPSKLRRKEAKGDVAPRVAGSR